MRFKILILLLIVFKLSFSQNNPLDSNKLTYINNVIELFKQSNTDGISAIINYPLRREYPIPTVKNEIEFKQRFTTIFDKTLIDRIANSKSDQWTEVGWRGIMLDKGIIWIDSYEGKIIAVNYQSIFEQKQIQELIENEKQKLHYSIKSFQRPVYKIVTKHYLIRIDKLSDDNYRYVSWKMNGNESSKPDIILTNGVKDYEGNGGNHVITFTTKNYSYKIYRNIIGTDESLDITLIIEKNRKIIFTEDGNLLEIEKITSH